MEKITEQEYQQALCVVKAFHTQKIDELNRVEKEIGITLPFHQLNISVRLHSALVRNFGREGTLNDVAKTKFKDWKERVGIGKKTLVELEQILYEHGIGWFS